MSIWFAQALAYFQRLVNEVLSGLTFAFSYLDDILVFSLDMETHLKHLRLLFERLRSTDLKLKEVKCHFLKKHIQYLGHIVSGEGITPLPEKLVCIQKMLPPKTLKEVKQFLGLIGYYRKFVPRFSDLARPLNALTRKNVEFEWTPVCQESFNLLKTSLMTEPILTYPDPSLSYVPVTDASKYAWACVLTQEKTHTFEGKETKILHPFTYMSGLFKGSQINWACLTKEAYAIYMSIKKITYYLEDLCTCQIGQPSKKIFAYVFSLFYDYLNLFTYNFNNFLLKKHYWRSWKYLLLLFSSFKLDFNGFTVAVSDNRGHLGFSKNLEC